MTSEWLKVMLEEIERKRAEAEQMRLEERRRGAAAGDPLTPPRTPSGRTPTERHE